MKGLPKMPILRLAYVALFLIALMAVFVAWGAIAGQDHIDLLPWHIKLALGMGLAFAIVKATAAAVSGKQAWNAGSVKWFGVILLLAAGCALASWYAHVYLEEPDEEQQEEAGTSASYEPPASHGPAVAPRTKTDLAYRAPSSYFRVASVPVIRNSLAPLLSSTTSRPSSWVAPRPV